MTRKKAQKESFQTLAIHADKSGRSRSAGDPVIDPVFMSTVYRLSDGEVKEPWVYSRLENPNRDRLETMLAVLEGGVDCAAFASGMAASTAVVQSLATGDHLLIPHDLYHGTRRLVQEIMKPWGLAVEAVDMTDPAAVENALRPETRMIWAETPSNPHLDIIDLQTLAGICSRNDLLFVVDNTWASPYNQLPLKYGADLVVHSTSKYIGGHSDLVGGAVITSEKSELFDKIRIHQRISGGIPSPSDCWLMLRSIRTLPLRVRSHNGNAERIARFLEKDGRVQQVFYPGLSTHPGHEVASRQMSGFGGMVSFLVDGDYRATARVVQGARLIEPATSLGGVESTWEHRIRSEGPNSGTAENLIRLSVGLEDPDELIEDIGLALHKI